jgi:hypothetical protein
VPFDSPSPSGFPVANQVRNNWYQFKICIYTEI